MPIAALYGLPLVIFYGLVAHFIFPLSSFFSYALHAGGIVLFMLHSIKHKKNYRVFLTWFGYYLAIVIYTAIQVLHAPIVYDTGLYHLQAIRWVQEEPIVFGLANLHDRFGFNSIQYIFSAVIQLPQLENVGAFVVNGVFLTITVFYFFTVAGDKNSTTFSRIFSLTVLALLFLLQKEILWQVGSPATDFPPMLLTCIATHAFLFPRGVRDLNFVTLLLVTIVLFKVSYLPFVLIMLGWMILHARNRILKHVWILSICLVVCWFARNIILSGCLLFPVQSTCITTLPWTVDKQTVELAQKYIYSWARQPGLHPDVVLGNNDWILGWIVKNSNSIFITYGVIHLVSIRYFLVGLKKTTPKDILSFFVVAVGYVVNIVYWFVTAPDIRFIHGIFLGSSVIALSYTVFSLTESVGSNKKLNNYFRQGAHLTFRAFLFYVLWLVCILIPMEINRPSQWPIIVKNTIRLEETNSGVIIRVPKEDYCWDAVLPCTPYFSSKIDITQQGTWKMITR